MGLATHKRGEVVEVEERPTDYSMRYQESEEPELSPAKSPQHGHQYV